MTKKALVILALFAGGCSSVSTAYVHADRATKRSVEPLLNIVARDNPQYAPGVKDLLDSWELRVGNAEKGIFPQP